jgi:TRAP-type C4-dicarboxylate transport system permease small subunit
MNCLRKLINFVNRASLLGAYIGSAACSLMVLLCLAEVFSRTFLNISIVISTELLPWFLVCMVFIGISWTLRIGGHVEITVVTEHLPPKVKKWLNISTYIIGILSFGFFCAWVWEGLKENYVGGTIGFNFPLWWAWVPMFIGSIVFMLQLLAMLLDNILSLNQANLMAERPQGEQK